MAEIGTVVLMSKAPKGFLLCDGRKLKINDYQMLYGAIHGKVQADGIYFWLPNLPDKFGFRHVICHAGDFSEGYKYTVDFNDDERIIGTMVPFNGENIPDGWMLPDGLEYEVEAFRKAHPEGQLLPLAIGTYRKVSNPSYFFFQMPDTGKERYILCKSGIFLQ